MAKRHYTAFRQYADVLKTRRLFLRYQAWKENGVEGAKLWSIRVVAKRVGVNEKYLGQAENKKLIFSAQIHVRLGEVLGIDSVPGLFTRLLDGIAGYFPEDCLKIYRRHPHEVLEAIRKVGVK